MGDKGGGEERKRVGEGTRPEEKKGRKKGARKRIRKALIWYTNPYDSGTL